MLWRLETALHLDPMSGDINSQSSTDVQHQKKSKQKKGEGNKTKRKHDVFRSIESAEQLPIKKHRISKSKATSTKTATSEVDLDSPAQSPFHLETFSLYLPLSPICQVYPLEGLCAEHLSPLILTYYQPFKGVVLSYSNTHLSEQPQKRNRNAPASTILAKSIDEYAVSFVWLTADFLVFRPRREGWIEGWINLQNESHLGIVCWNLFNASIERTRLPKTWRWIAAGVKSKSKAKLKYSRGDSSADEDEEEVVDSLQSSQGVQEDEGYFEDAEGNKIEGSVRFRVVDVETSSSIEKEKSFLSIEGTLLSAQEEEDLLEKERSMAQTGSGGAFSYTMSGALTNDGLANQTDGLGDNVQKYKHRIKY